MADYGAIKVNKVTYKNGSDADTDFNFKTDIVATSDLNLKAAKAGDTFTGNIVLDNDKEVRFSEADSNGSAYIGLKAPTDLGSVSSYTLTLPTTAAGTNKVLKTDSSTATQLVWGDDTALSLLDEDNFATNSATAAPSQQSTKAYVDAHIIDEDNFSSDSATKPASQQSIKAYITATSQPLDADTAKTDTLQAWTKPQVGTPGAITHGSAGAMNIDLSASNNFEITLNADGILTFTNFTNAKGQTGLISIKNGGTNAVTYADHVLFAGGTDAAVTATANAVSLLTYYVYDVTGSSEKVIVTGIADVKDS